MIEFYRAQLIGQVSDVIATPLSKLPLNQNLIQMIEVLRAFLEGNTSIDHIECDKNLKKRFAYISSIVSEPEDYIPPIGQEIEVPEGNVETDYDHPHFKTHIVTQEDHQELLHTVKEIFKDKINIKIQQLDSLVQDTTQHQALKVELERQNQDRAVFEKKIAEIRPPEFDAATLTLVEEGLSIEQIEQLDENFRFMIFEYLDSVVCLLKSGISLKQMEELDPEFRELFFLNLYSINHICNDWSLIKSLEEFYLQNKEMVYIAPELFSENLYPIGILLLFKGSDFLKILKQFDAEFVQFVVEQGLEIALILDSHVTLDEIKNLDLSQRRTLKEDWTKIVDQLAQVRTCQEIAALDGKVKSE